MMDLRDVPGFGKAEKFPKRLPYYWVLEGFGLAVDFHSDSEQAAT